MPEEKKQEEFKVNKSMNDLSNTKDVLSMMQSALNTPSGKKLVTELREIQQELKGRGLKLEDQLIVGTKTLKDSVKDWDKKGLSIVKLKGIGTGKFFLSVFLHLIHEV